MEIGVYSNVKRVTVLMKKIQPRLKAIMRDVAVRYYDVTGDTEVDKSIRAQLHNATVNIFLWMGSGLDNSFLQRSAKWMKDLEKPFLIIVDNAENDQISFGFTVEQIKTAWDYRRYDGDDNMYNLMLWLAKKFCGVDCNPEPPAALPWHGIWHPDWQGAHQDIKGYLENHYVEGRPTAGVLFYRTEWMTGDYTYQNALIKALEANGLNVIGFFANSTRDERTDAPALSEVMDYYFYQDGKRLIDVLINTMKFSLKTSGTPISYIQKLNVPLLQAYTVLNPIDEWQQSPVGLDPVNVSISVSLPEFDGIVHTVPIAAKIIDDDGDMVYTNIPERMNKLAEKAFKWGILGKKANEDKKIAIIFHNYPPTNSNIGSAAGLDSPESVRRLLIHMKNAGYSVDNIPSDSKAFIKLLTDGSTNDRRFLSDEKMETGYQKLSCDQYCHYFESLPEKVRERMEQEWGKAPGSVFIHNDNVLVPGTINGNVFITVQPPRGFGEDSGKILHSPDLPPPHHYFAVYYWLEKVWQADAVIHVGTHGSLEWLPGKSTALSKECYPDIAIGTLPNIYPYWVNISGEGIQAKRRSSACLVSHLSPPMQLSGAFEGLADMERLLDEYIHFRANQPEKLEEIKELVREQAAACSLDTEIQETEDFNDYVDKLHIYITELKNMQIRTGLHTLGQMPEGEELVEYVMSLVRLEHGESQSLIRLMAKWAGHDYDELKANSMLLTDNGQTYGHLLDSFEQNMHNVVARLFDNGFSDEAAADELNNSLWDALEASEKEQLKQAIHEICYKIVPKLRLTSQEITNIAEALAGKYIEPSESGAPTVCGDTVLPTGRNFYGVDPRCLPTKAAWECGKRLGDDLIAQFIKDEGRYPEAVGLVLWSGSNMRSHGQCIAEYLYLMGVKPIWRPGSGRVFDIEVIPLEELQRPRIDITGRISGLFRDTMPNAVQWMDKAVKLVCELDEGEDENYVRKHIIADSSWLMENGETAEAAWEKASYRVFGDPPGAYGAGINNVLDEKNWDTIDDLAAVYIRYSGTAYGSDGLPGDYQEEMFKRRMRCLDITVKNEDNRENNMFTTDDHNAYHGGMIATVKALTGKAPKSYSADSSDSSRFTIRTVDQEAKRLFRAEAMNPKFIQGMKKHDYKGATELSNYLLHSYQWDATSDVLEDWMYEGFAEKYALDKEIQQWMREVNPWALQRIADILLEASQRGMWKAKQETLAGLRELYLELEGDLEDQADS